MSHKMSIMYIPNEMDKIKNNPYLSIEEKRKRLEELEIKSLRYERDYYKQLASRYAKELGIENNI